jgi:hypothetical protein
VVSPPPFHGPDMREQRRVRHGVDRDGLLHQSVEQLPAMAGRAPIEAEGEFIQV